MKISASQRAKLARQGIGAAIGGNWDLAFKGFQAAATGKWEGGETSRYRNRPGTRLVAQDTDLNYGVREKLISEARDLEQNFPLVGRIKKQYADYCVGSCRIKWNTGDENIDKIYNANWQNWMNVADANGKDHFVDLTKIALSSTVGDGDHFGQKLDSGGLGQLRLIEGDRVTNARGGMFNFDEESIIGGIGISASGRPIFARVCQRSKHGSGSFINPIDVPWQQIVHMVLPTRADAYRGVTQFHSVLNTIRDLKETVLAERLAAKKNSKLAVLIKSIMGGAISGNGVDLFENPDTTQADSPQVNVEELNDVATKYMFPGEDLKAHESNRPSQGWLYLMEWLVREIAIGLNLPFGVVWNMAGLGGPAARFEINQAGRTFLATTEVLERRWIRPIAGWVTAKHISAGRLPFHPNWTQFSIARPRYITIDLGRESKAGIEENKAGLYTATDWFEEDGGDFEEKTERLAYEEAFRIKMAEKYKIKPESIRMLTPNGNDPGEKKEEEVQREKTPAR